MRAILSCISARYRLLANSYAPGTPACRIHRHRRGNMRLPHRTTALYMRSHSGTTQAPARSRLTGWNFAGWHVRLMRPRIRRHASWRSWWTGSATMPLHGSGASVTRMSPSTVARSTKRQGGPWERDKSRASVTAQSHGGVRIGPIGQVRMARRSIVPRRRDGRSRYDPTAPGTASARRHGVGGICGRVCSTRGGSFSSRRSRSMCSPNERFVFAAARDRRPVC